MSPFKIDLYHKLEAAELFEQARERQNRRFWRCLVSRQPSQLLDLSAVLRRIPFEGQVDTGLQEIPLSQIAGSIGRSNQFDGAFLPKRDALRERWIKIAEANLAGAALPPIEVTQIGSVYFVRDGNHRVSVARMLNQGTIQAYVSRINVPAEIAGQPDLDAATRDYERVRFQKSTRLADIRPTIPGFYQRMLEHINTHRWLMGVERREPIAWEDAVRDWYQRVYLPIVAMVRESHLLVAFPKRTEADLYLWIADHHWYQSARGGPEISFESAVNSFVNQTANRLQRGIYHLFQNRARAGAPERRILGVFLHGVKMVV